MTISLDTNKETNDRRAQMLETINSLNEKAREDLTLDQLLVDCLDIILSDPWLAIESKGSIFLMNDQNELVLKTQKDLDPQLLVKCARIRVGRCLCGQAAERKDIIHSTHLDPDNPGAHEITYEGIHNHGHYCVPMISKEKLLGVLNLYLQAGQENNQEEVRPYLWGLANVLAGIIEQKKTERALQRNHEKLCHAQEIASIGSWEWDMQSGKIAHSPVFRKLLGKDLDCLNGVDQFIKLVSEKDQNRVKEELELAIKNAKINQEVSEKKIGSAKYDISHELKHEEGHIVTIRSMGEVFVYANKRVRIEGIFQDISNQEKERVLDALGLLTKEYKGSCHTPSEVRDLSIALASFFGKNTGTAPMFFESAIHELLMNGLEYGIIGLSSEEKTELMRNRSVDFGEELEKRCNLPENRRKKVRAHFQVKETEQEIRYELTIEDDGPGFDYQKLLNANPKEATEKARREFHGLGLVTILRFAFKDEIKYFPPGNKVRVTKVVKKG